jgi:hypothetical protein
MTMRTHLDEETLLDVMEGRASADAARHARECAECGGRVGEAREGWSLASSAEVPAPSPLFWTAFRSRVASALAAPARPRLPLFAPALLAAAAMIAAVLYLPGSLTPPPGAAPVARSSPVLEVTTFEGPVSEDDLGECPDVAACVAGLSDDDSRAFVDALRAELAGSGDL